MSTTLNERHWLERINQCRSSGLTARQWCMENGIPVSTFYYHVRVLRKKACEIPETESILRQKQELDSKGVISGKRPLQSADKPPPKEVSKNKE